MATSALSPAAKDVLGVNILLVEDDPRQSIMVGNALIAAGYIVVHGASPREAEQLLARRIKIDILVTDIDLNAELSGLHVVHLARHYRPNIPALVVSGRSSEQFDAQRFSRAGFLRKPFTPASLLSAIARLIERAATSTQSRNMILYPALGINSFKRCGGCRDEA